MIFLRGWLKPFDALPFRRLTNSSRVLRRVGLLKLAAFKVVSKLTSDGRCTRLDCFGLLPL